MKYIDLLKKSIFNFIILFNFIINNQNEISKKMIFRTCMYLHCNLCTVIQ